MLKGKGDPEEGGAGWSITFWLDRETAAGKHDIVPVRQTEKTCRQIEGTRTRKKNQKLTSL